MTGSIVSFVQIGRDGLNKLRPVFAELADEAVGFGGGQRHAACRCTIYPGLEDDIDLGDVDVDFNLRVVRHCEYGRPVT